MNAITILIIGFLILEATNVVALYFFMVQNMQTVLTFFPSAINACALNSFINLAYCNGNKCITSWNFL